MQLRPEGPDPGRDAVLGVVSEDGEHLEHLAGQTGLQMGARETPEARPRRVSILDPAASELRSLGIHLICTPAYSIPLPAIHLLKDVLPSGRDHLVHDGEEDLLQGREQLGQPADAAEEGVERLDAAIGGHAGWRGTDGAGPSSRDRRSRNTHWSDRGPEAHTGAIEVPKHTLER